MKKLIEVTGEKDIYDRRDVRAVIAQQKQEYEISYACSLKFMYNDLKGTKYEDICFLDKKKFKPYYNYRIYKELWSIMGWEWAPKAGSHKTFSKATAVKEEVRAIDASIS